MNRTLRVIRSVRKQLSGEIEHASENLCNLDRDLMILEKLLTALPEYESDKILDVMLGKEEEDA